MKSLGFSFLLITLSPRLLLSAEVPSAPSKSAMKSVTNVSAIETESLLQSHPEIVVIDVRTQEEFAEGHIAGAKNVNFNAANFNDRMKEFSGKPILLHCAAGGRSSRALESLGAIPFEKVYHLNKGFNDWMAAGKPVSKK